MAAVAASFHEPGATTGSQPRSTRASDCPPERTRSLTGVGPSSPRSTTSTPAPASSSARRRPSASGDNAVTSVTSAPAPAASVAARPAPPALAVSTGASTTGAGASRHTRRTSPSQSMSSSASPMMHNRCRTTASAYPSQFSTYRRRPCSCLPRPHRDRHSRARDGAPPGAVRTGRTLSNSATRCGGDRCELETRGCNGTSRDRPLPQRRHRDRRGASPGPVLAALVGPAEEAPTFELAVSELVTNALVHGEGVVEVTLTATGTSVRLEVLDHGHDAYSGCPPGLRRRGREVGSAPARRPVRCVGCRHQPHRVTGVDGDGSRTATDVPRTP